VSLVRRSPFVSNDPKRTVDNADGGPAVPDDTRVPIEVAIAEEIALADDPPEHDGREFIAELVDVREELLDLIADD
jgi:hypothetical protein